MHPNTAVERDANALSRPGSAGPAVWVGVTFLLCTASACADLHITPTATTSDATVTLTVRVKARATEIPIRGALVRYNANAPSYTDVSGQSVLKVVPALETTIDVSAPGYETMAASGVLAGDERWTFFLALDSASGAAR